MQQYMPFFNAFTDFQSPVYLIMLVKINILEAYDILHDSTKHKHEQKDHTKKDIQHSELYFTAVSSNSLENLSPVNSLFTPLPRDLGRPSFGAPGSYSKSLT